MSNLDRMMLEHWENYFGEPVAIVDGSAGVSLYIWVDPDNEDTRIVTTLGMSRRAQRIPDGQSCVSARPRTELMMFAKDTWLPIIQSMTMDLAAYPFTNGTFLHWWQTLRIGRPCTDGSVLDSLLITFPPYDNEGFATVSAGLERIDILWVVPIAESEKAYADAHGVEKLEDLLEEQGVDLIDLHRKPIC